MLSVSNLFVRYGAVEAVRGTTMSIKEGELVTLLGTNGAGKSSILNAIVGLVKTRSGTIYFNNENITCVATELIVRRGITLSPEGRRIFARLSVLENLKLGSYSNTDSASVNANFKRVFDLFPVLHERQEQLAGTLSGGQQQMLAIGRALMINPRFLLLDEPSLGLAPKIVETIFTLIAGLQKAGITILMVEQNASMALEIADRGYVMANGEIVAHGLSSELKTKNLIKLAYLG